MTNPNITEFSTAAKIILSEWKVLTNIIRNSNYPDPTQVQADTMEPTLPLLSDIELFNALQGPFHFFFNEKINAYAILARFRLHHTIVNDEQLKAKLPEDKSISNKSLQKVSSSGLKKIQDELIKITSVHFEQCTNFMLQIKEELLSLLEENKLLLTEMERNIFLHSETISNLTNRFQDLKIPLPKSKKNQSYLEEYLKYQIYLTIHSALSRQHLPHENSNILEMLKKIEPCWKKIRKQEKELAEQQKKETEEIIEPIKL